MRADQEGLHVLMPLPPSMEFRVHKPEETEIVVPRKLDVRDRHANAVFTVNDEVGHIGTVGG
jgi:hypothetical protein